MSISVFLKFILRMVCAYTKLGWQRTKGVYDSGKTKGGGYTKYSDIGNESWYALMIKGSPK